MENVTVRGMEPGEAGAVYRLGRGAFDGIERVWMPKPKQALVAVRDGEIVGAVLYKLFLSGGKKIGYVDYAFTGADCHNMGIGNLLYAAAVDFLWGEGCDALTAVVKDDNVGSWSLFLKNGFARVSLPGLIREFGLGGAIKQYFGTPLCFGVGMEYYVATKSEHVAGDKGGSGKQILAYVLANSLLLGVGILVNPKEALAVWVAYLCMLLAGIGVSALGTRFSASRDWRFRLNNGGILVYMLVNLGSIFPMVGNWYPSQYEKTERFRRDMGIPALMEWCYLLAVTAVCAFGGMEYTVVRILGQIGTFLLIYKSLPFYPFESFGGGRVYRWRKPIYFLMAALSLVVAIVMLKIL